MQRLEFSGAVRHMYESLGVKRLIVAFLVYIQQGKVNVLTFEAPI